MTRDSFPSDPREPDWSLDRAQDLSSDERAHGEEPVAPRSEPSANDHPKPEAEDRPREYVLGRRAFSLRDSEIGAMAELGTFRVVAPEDLSRYAYEGDINRMERELRRLRTEGLVIECTLPASGRRAVRVVALTRRGKLVLRKSRRVDEDQVVYYGIVKTREAKHDAALYRLFHAEAARIAREGGRPLRVILDYELKRDLYRERAEMGERLNDPAELRSLARRHGLKVVNGKIPLPDLRIEYQTAEFEQRQIDLELTTLHYRARGIGEKTRAGFSLYAPREEAPRLRRVLDEQELSARIFAL